MKNTEKCVFFQEKINIDLEESARVQSWNLHMFCSQCFRQFFHWLFHWHWRGKVPGELGFMSSFSRFLLESRPLSVLSKHRRNAMFVSFDIEMLYFVVHLVYSRCADGYTGRRCELKSRPKYFWSGWSWLFESLKYNNEISLPESLFVCKIQIFWL